MTQLNYEGFSANFEEEPRCLSQLDAPTKMS